MTNLERLQELNTKLKKLRSSYNEHDAFELELIYDRVFQIVGSLHDAGGNSFYGILLGMGESSRHISGLSGGSMKSRKDAYKYAYEQLSDDINDTINILSHKEQMGE